MKCICGLVLLVVCVVFFSFFLSFFLSLSPRTKQPVSLLLFSVGVCQIAVSFNRSLNYPVLFNIYLSVVS